MAITVYTATREKILLENEPFATPGGEGAAHRIIATPNYSNYCAKIYQPLKRTNVRKQKLEYMVQNKPQNLITSNYVICFPTEVIFDYNKKFLGFIMPLAFNGSEKLYELATAQISPRLYQNWGKFDRTSQQGIEKRLKVCVNIAIAINSIHQSGKYAIVDYKPQNILITNEGKISIIDVDSFQISNNGNVLFHSEVATPEYAPPEAARLNPSKVFINESWDRFSLAVSFYEILYGIHPYTATCDGQYSNITTIGESIQKGLFVHGSKRSYLTFIPPLHKDFNFLPLPIQKLFIKAFEEGHTNPNTRPTAEDWGKQIVMELETKIAIKPNTITLQPPIKIPRKAAATTTGKPPTKYTAPIKSKPTTYPTRQQAKKEDYMIWKILTAILAIVSFFLFVKSNDMESKLNTANSQASNFETEKSNLQSQISTIQSSQSSIEGNYNSRISELQNNIDAIGQKYPFTLTDISFNNINNAQEFLVTETHDFLKSELQYVQPVLKYNSNLRVGINITVNYKIFDSSEKLLTGANSPSGYSWYGQILCAGDFGLNNSDKLGGYSLGCPFYCSAGHYRVEIWYNGLMLGESYFNINE